MAPVDLHQLPHGTIVATSGLTAQRLKGVSGHDWVLVGNTTGYTVGDLLAMSQDWVVLRHGSEVPGTGTPEVPEVRHYIAESGELRGHMTMTSREDHGRIVSDRHPWEPLTAEDGWIWYRVGDAVAAEYDWGPDETDETDPPRASCRLPFSAGPVPGLPELDTMTRLGRDNLQ